MKWDPFKNRLKKEAQQQKDAVDIDALWSAIEPEVDALNGNKNNRKSFFMWFFFGAALIMTGAWFALSNGNTATSDLLAEKERLTEERKRLVDKTKLNNNSIAETKETKMIENTEENPSVVSTSEFQKKENTSSENLDKTNSKTTVERKNLNGEFVKNNQAITLDENANKPNDLSPLNSETDAERNGMVNSPLDKQKSKLTDSQRIVAETSGRSQAEPSTASSEIQKTIQTEEERTTGNLTLAKEISSQINAPSLLANLNKGYISIKNDSLSEFSDFSSSRDYFARNRKKQFDFSFGLTVGISYANRNLNQKEGNESVLLQNRKDYESSLETSHYGFFVGAKHKKTGLGITIGLQNTNIAERYKYKDVQQTTQMIDGVEVRRVNLEGDTIDIMGQLPKITTRTIDKNIYNSYRLLDIPVILSYQRSIGELRFGVEAGVLVNLSLKTEGIVPNALLEDQDIDNSQNDMFKSKLGLGYHFGLSVGGNLTKHLEWNLAPMLRAYPSDFSGATNELSQRYVLYGVNGGVSYRF